MVKVILSRRCNMSRASKKSFHTFITLMIRAVMVMGFNRGKTTMKKVWKGLAPSIFAASSISMGICP
jgi:hypothetical protein